MSTTESKHAFHSRKPRTPSFRLGVTTIRCYFMRDGHIEAVEELPGLSDEKAIAKAHALFSERKHLFEGFEVWDRTRALIRHPQSPAPEHVVVWPLPRGLKRAVPLVRPAASPPKG